MIASASPPTTIVVENIPQELRDREQWVLWRYESRKGRRTKVPKQADGTNAASDNPATWTTFDRAIEAYRRSGFDGIGYMFSKDDPYFGVDLDHIAERRAWALGIVGRFATYAEPSVSGEGIHIIGRGKMPAGGRNNQKEGIEAYDRGRFFTFTGQTINEGNLPISEAQAALDWLLAEHFKPKGPRVAVTVDRTAASEPLGDADARILERMFRGQRGDQIRRLHDGDSGDFRRPDGSSDLSGADQSYFNALAFWFGKDAPRMARVARGSRRHRDKWDERHASDGSTYLDLTIGTAIGGCTRTFEDLTGYPADKVFPRLEVTEKNGADAGATPEPARGSDGAETCLGCNARDDQVMQLAAIIEAQQSVICAQRERLEILEPIVTSIDEVIQRPDEELNSDDKVATIALGRWLPYHQAKREAAGEPATVSLGYLSKVVGMPKRRLSKSIDRLSSDRPDDGAPFSKVVTRRPKFDADGCPVINPRTGKQAFESSFEVGMWAKTAKATLCAAARYETPPRPKHGGSRAASDARWGRCPTHEAADVVVRGRCSDCGSYLSERRISADDFEKLALNVQLEHSENPPAAVGDQYPVEAQDGRSDASGQDLQPGDSEASFDSRAAVAVAVAISKASANGTTGNGHAAGANGHADGLVPLKASTWRHHCGSFERHGGRCDGCNEVIP
jgi:hypothetical protein